MKTYRLAIIATPPAARTAVDLQVAAHTAVDALTIVDAAGTTPLHRPATGADAPTVTVWVLYQALNPVEACTTARAALTALAYETAVDHAVVRQIEPRSTWSARVTRTTAVTR